MLILVVFVFSTYADVKLNDQTVVVFSTVEKGKEILGQRDDYVASMSPFDRAVRMKTDKGVSEEEYLAFVKRDILPWDESEVAKLEAMLKSISTKISKLPLILPETIYLIKTTGQEEGGAPYTRGNAIVLPKSKLASTDLQKTVIHELFHILSRHDLKLRERLYTDIGFKPCNEIDFPTALKPRADSTPKCN